MVKLFDDTFAYRFDGHDSINLISEELHADDIVGVGQCDVDGVSFHTESSACQLNVVSYVLRSDELFQ